MKKSKFLIYPFEFYFIYDGILVIVANEKFLSNSVLNYGSFDQKKSIYIKL